MQVLTLLVRKNRSTVLQEKLGWEVNRDGKLVWLQKLAMFILRKFGQQAIVPIQKTETIRIPVEYDSIINAARVQIMELREMNMEPKCIYLGQDFVNHWRNEFLQADRADFRPMSVPFSFGNHLQRSGFVETPGIRSHFDNGLFGLPLVIVPNFNGIFVAPDV